MTGHCHVNDSMESLVGHWLSQLDDPLINPLFVSLYSDARCRSAVRLHPSRRIRTSAPSAEPWWPRRSSSRISWPKSLQVSRTILLQLCLPPRRACVCVLSRPLIVHHPPRLCLPFLLLLVRFFVPAFLSWLAVSLRRWLLLIILGNLLWVLCYPPPR